MTDVTSMWRYIHARTVARVWPRVKPRVPDHGAALERFLRRAVEARASCSILQVGAFDGSTNDPVHALIRDYQHVRAVLLEPQPAAFQALTALWANEPRVVPLQAAFGERVGERPLWVISPEHRDSHPFADQIASFSREYVRQECSRYVWRPSADFLSSVSVRTVDWQTLAAAHGPFDMVVIDTEGYDGEVLRKIDLSAAPPQVILYEHRHLGAVEREDCMALLRSAGYLVSQVNKADTVASRIGTPGF